MSARDVARAQVKSLSLPSSVMGGVGGAVAVLYGALTVELVPGTLVRFLVLSACVLAVLVPVGELRLRAKLKGLRAVASRRDAPSPQALLDAVREVTGFPDAVFVNMVQMWILGSGSIGVLYKVLAPGVGWDVVLRLLLIGLLFGPVDAVLTYLISAARVRRALEELAAQGLTTVQVLAAIPPQRLQVRRRFLAMASLCVLMPAIAALDVSQSVSRRGVASVAAAESLSAKAVAADRARTDLLISMLGTIALIAAFAAGTARLAGAVVAEPMRRIAHTASRVASGALDAPAIVPAEDEIWAVSAAFTAAQAHLVTALGELRRAGIQIGSTTEEIVATSTRYESGAAEQATSLNETSATTEELARSARQIAENATSVAELARKTWESAQGAQQSADAFNLSLGRMRQDNESISGAVTRLSQRVQQIGRIVEFINGVADKSDLLALNAELEGTKAGEVGRGFSLVAAEMRRLAENVIESTNEIEELIDEIRGATVAAVAATEGGLKATEGGSSLADSVASSLEQITALAEKTTEAVKAISVSTQQQQAGTDQLAETMSNILRVTHQSLMATKQVTAANVDLSAVAKELNSVVQRFQLS